MMAATIFEERPLRVDAALIAELVDWARTAGFDVVCAGKGTKHLPQYHESTPDTVWSHYGFTKEQLATGDFNPQMFNSFLDGTKSALEMCAVANGCELSPPSNGLEFPPCGIHDLPTVLRPRSDGGHLEKKGMVEVVSSLELDGRQVANDIRFGVFVVIEGQSNLFPSPWVTRAVADGGETCFLISTLAHRVAISRPFPLALLQLKLRLLTSDSSWRLPARMLRTVRHENRQHRPVRRAVQALPSHRPRAWCLGCQHHVPRRADRAD